MPLRERQAARPAWILTLLASAATLALVLPFFVIYANSFVHPHRFENHLPLLVPDTVRVTGHDFLKPFQEFAPGEFRPRFLTYLIILIDLKLRLAAYALGVLPPAFTVAWILELVVGPWLLYRLLVEFTGDRQSSWLAVLVYVASTGFLSGVTMLFMPGKPLTNVLFIAALYLTRRAAARADTRQVIPDIRSAAVPALLAVIFLGLLLDEASIFVLVLVPLVFPELFVGGGGGRAAVLGTGRAMLLFATPVIAFLVLVVFVTPAVTRRFFGYDFDYFSTLLGYGAGAAGARSIYEGPYGRFSAGSLLDNTGTLLGASLVPRQLSQFVSRPGSGGVLSGQTHNVWQALILLAAIGGAIYLAARSGGAPARWFRRLAVATAAFVVFQSLLSGRHVPYITGYYYGSAFAVFFALLVGLVLAMLAHLGGRARLAAVGVAIAVVVVQIDNFHALNQSYLFIHNERMTRASHEATIPIAAGTPVTARELRAIWKAWRRGNLAAYLEHRPVSSGAVFLVVELRWLDRLRQRSS